MFDLGLILMTWEVMRGWHDQPKSPRLEREARAGPKRQGRFVARLRAWLARWLPAPETEQQAPLRAAIKEAKQASGTGGGMIL